MDRLSVETVQAIACAATALKRGELKTTHPNFCESVEILAQAYLDYRASAEAVIATAHKALGDWTCSECGCGDGEMMQPISDTTIGSDEGCEACVFSILTYHKLAAHRAKFPREDPDA